MFHIFLLLMYAIPRLVWGHCYGIGNNPGFSDSPIIKQLTAWSVRVSWKEIVTQRECSDHFLIKYWKTEEPQNVMVSKIVDSHINHLDLEVDPETEYTFKVVAREVKKLFGIQWDTDDNHSEPEVFRTQYEHNNCIWSTLGIWSQCSTTCGIGNQTAHRHILREASHGGRPCIGPKVISRPCQNSPCRDNQSHESNSEGEGQPPHSKERLNTYSSPTPSNAELSDSRETPSDGRAKNVDVQIYSVKKDAYDSNGSPEYPLQRPSIFPYSSSVISTLATVTENVTPDPLSPIVSFQEPLEDQGSQQVERRNPEKGMLFSRHEKGEDKSDSTIFLGIGGFMVASCLLATICLLIYKRFRKPSIENIELINEDSVIEGVEFHTIDAMKQEENIYEPAPGEVSVGRNQNKDGDTRSCSSNLENHM